MTRWTRSVPIYVSVLLIGALLPAGVRLAGASATPLVSRPIVWVSGQDSGQVFITRGTTILKTFDFAHGTPAGTPVVPGVGSPTPGLDVASPKPHLITFSPDARFAYVSFQNTNPGRVAVINTATRQVQTVISIPTSLPTTASPRVTQAKPSPDGTFLLVGEVGPPGVIVKVAVDEAHLTWTPGTQLAAPANQGPACLEFSPVDGHAYYDSSLSPMLGVGVLDPATMTLGAFYPTIGDPQCGFHDPIDVGGTPTVIVTDSGTPTGGVNPDLGHVHALDTATDAFTEFSFSPFFAKNLHDNWPVQLEPVGAPTSDSPSIVYGSDRDSDILKQINISTGAINDLTMNPPNVPVNGRGAIDTLDGSGDTVFAAMKETGDLGIVDGFNHQTFLHLHNPDPSCSDPASPNFHKCFVVHAVTVQPLEHTTTTLVVQPASSAFGSSVTFTATVAPATPNPDLSPTGTISFFLDGQATAVATVPLGANGMASFSTSGLGAGHHTVVARYSGDTNFFPSHSAPATATVTAGTTLSGNQGTIIVRSGTSLLLLNATVAGSVVVQPGGTLDVENSTISGGITASNPAALRVCGSTTGGSVSVTRATGFVLIGDPGDDGCAVNAINGSLSLTSNTGGVEALGNHVTGSLVSSGNSGTGAFPEDTAPEIGP